MAPKGPLGAPRLTSLGPLTKGQVRGIEEGVITILHRMQERPGVTIVDIEESITETTGGEIHGDVRVLSSEEVEELVGVPTPTPAIIQETHLSSVTEYQLEESIEGVKKAIDTSYINYFVFAGW